jgi:IS605 OrfB family transposase
VRGNPAKPVQRRARDGTSCSAKRDVPPRGEHRVVEPVANLSLRFQIQRFIGLTFEIYHCGERVKLAERRRMRSPCGSPLSTSAWTLDWTASPFSRMALRLTIPGNCRAGLKHLRRAQRRLSRRKRGSQRCRKAVVLVAQAHRRIRNQRAGFHHLVSRQLVNRYGLIAVEDLHIRGLARCMLARSVHDAGWNSFFAKLSYKAASAGRVLVKVDSRGTTCVCGAQVPKTLTDRWHQCPACGLWAPRDVVSAQVITPTRPDRAFAA